MELSLRMSSWRHARLRGAHFVSLSRAGGREEPFRKGDDAIYRGHNSLALSGDKLSSAVSVLRVHPARDVFGTVRAGAYQLLGRRSVRPTTFEEGQASQKPVTFFSSET